MRPRRLTATLLAGAAAVPLLAAFGSSCGSSQPDLTRTVAVRVGEGEVRAELASDEAARRRGLAGRERLPTNRGMLFVYPDRLERTYWMKGMRFPIDIVWIDRKSVRGVERNVPVPRGGDLPLYSSDGPADRVLEVPAGWAARHGVRAGSHVLIDARTR